MVKFAVYVFCLLADISGGGGAATPAAVAAQYVTYADLYAHVAAGNGPGMLYVGVVPARNYYMPVCYVPVLAGYNPGVYECRMHKGEPWRFPVSLSVPPAQVAPVAPCLNGRCPKVR